MKTYSLKYFLFSHKTLFAISVITFPLKHFFFSQIIYFLACNEDTNLTPYSSDLFGRKVALKHTALTAANYKVACTFCACARCNKSL